MKVKYPTPYSAYVELSWRDLWRLVMDGWIRSDDRAVRIDLGETKRARSAR